MGSRAGAGLEQLRTILEAGPSERRALLEQHHADLERRLQDIRASQRLTEHALDCPAGDFTLCPDFQSLVAETIRERVTPA